MAKAASQEPDLEEGVDAPPKKSKKKLILLVLGVLLLAGAGAAAYLLLSPPPAPKRGEQAKAEEAAHSNIPPKFVELGQLTVNLMLENEDRYLQATISIKVAKPELEEKIKAHKPEILHRVNMRLQSKYPSELSTTEGKEILAKQIKAEVEYVLGLRKEPPPMGSGADAAALGNTKSDISDVLFTSFIIQ